MPAVRRAFAYRCGVVWGPSPHTPAGACPEADPERYAVANRDAALGEDVPLALAVGHLRASSDDAFERQLRIVMTGLTATFGD